MRKTKLNYFELYKNSARDNEAAWLNDTPFISYGIVASVVDINTVVALPLANTDGFGQPVTLTLLHPSSALFESSVRPQEGDRVLMFALDIKAAGMFNSSEPVVDKNAVRRGIFSGVGVLLSTFKGLAATTVKHSQEAGGPAARLETAAAVAMLFGRTLTAVFDSINGNEELIRLAFGPLSPLLMEHRAATERKHGFDEDADCNEITVPAPVSERYSVKAPITKDIQGPQTVVIGIDAEGEATEAPVDVTIGENADVTVTSASGITLRFNKAVVWETADSQTWKIDGDLTLEVGGKVRIESAGCVINDVLEVK